MRVERDVEVALRDGVILRVDIFFPSGSGPHPVIMCAHPYGKDHTPARRRRRGGGNRGWRVPAQFHLLPQSESFSISAFTSWEAPDPVFWVELGYVVINADLRGWGRSDGVGELLSAQEGRDYHDLIEWAGTRSWSNGRVGLSGVSYLAIAQWAAAAQRPSHLAAISPWEGFTDFYRDFARPGGIREKGFLFVWQRGLRAQKRSPVTIGDEQRARPEVDDWWEARNRDLESVEVPALVCGSFSDHCLHSRGSFEGFRRIGSTHKWLYTHRGPKWSTYYSDEARAAQRRFFDHFLRGEDNGMLEVPRVRVEVREDASTITAVRHVETWPPPLTTWQPLFLAGGGDVSMAPLRRGTDLGSLVAVPGEAKAEKSFRARRGSLSFSYLFAEDTEIVGPMRLRLHVSLQGADDVNLFAGVEKRRAGRFIGFEGSYGFDRDLVTHGMLRASHRREIEPRPEPWLPVHPHVDRERLRSGEVVALEIELLASATHFRGGEELRLILQAHWFFRFNPLMGQFPARYERSRTGVCSVHFGGEFDSALHLPRQGAADPPH